MNTGQGQQQLPEILYRAVHHPANYVDVDPQIATYQPGEKNNSEDQ